MKANHDEALIAETVHFFKTNGRTAKRSAGVRKPGREEENTQFTREREWLRMVVDNLPDFIYVKDRQSRILFSNAAHVRSLGAARLEEVAGKTDLDIFPPDLANKFYEDEQALMTSGQPLEREEIAVEPKTGRTRWLQTTKIPLRDPQGQVIGLVGISRDITDMKSMQEEQRRSRDDLEKRVVERAAELSRERLVLRTLIDNLPDAIYAKDTAGRKTLVNNADLKNLRCKTEAEAVGKNDFDLFPKDVAEKFWADDQKVLAGQPVINREESFVNEENKRVWLLTSKLPWRDAEGKIIGLIGIGRDITYQREAELKLKDERNLLRTVIDNIPDSIYAKDTDARKVLANRENYKRLAFKTEAEALGKTDFDLYSKEEAAPYFADDQTVIKEGKPVINREEKILSRNGEKHWQLTSKIPWRDASGQVIGLVGIGHDITEFKKAQENLRESEEKLREFASQLERSNRELQDFAYVASHDLQEPLRKIVVFGERLREKTAGQLPPEPLDYLERMQRAASRMQTLINDLLTFSRVTSKAQPFTPVDLARTAHEVVDDLEGRIEMTKGRVELGELPVIEAEPLQMRQLIQNLIGNALKFRRPEEPPVVKIQARVYSGVLPQAAPDAPAQPLCELTVSDNGIGFDEKYLDRIFNVFQRLHTRNEYEGTGMGLAITRKIALYHHGAITAKSAEGQGATFIVTLPVAHPKPANHAA